MRLKKIKQPERELTLANKELVFQNREKEKRAAELIIANKELLFQNEEKEKRAAELDIANKELAYQNNEKENRAAELIIANKELAFQNDEKGKRAAELILANEELLYQNREKEKRAAELIVANRELLFQNKEKEKRAAELVIANRELLFQNNEKEKRAAELVIANNELSFQNNEKEKRAAELVIANKELSFQNNEKEKRDAELMLANEELLFQNREKEKRAAELIIANKKLLFQNKEKEKRAAELVIANKELAFQNKEKEKRAAELVIANDELAFQNNEKEKRAAELIIAKDQAEQSDRLKTAFLANMSHEIRTPMNGVLGFASLLKEADLTGEEQQEYIKLIEQSGIRMLNIINDIIDISKIESGLMEVRFKGSNINEQIDYIYTFFKPELERRKIQFSMKKPLQEKEACIITDREKMYAILTNLVKNAIKFTNEGSIKFGYNLKKENQAKVLEFFIKDTGIGVPKEKLEAIFERFIQADIADLRANQGTGLGLSISKAFVELMGGKIWVKSKEGTGSTFYFTTPYNLHMQTNTGIESFIQDTVRANVEIKKLRVLIVEDDKTSDLFLTTMLRKVSNAVLHAETGTKAVKTCRENPDLDLILMDIKMPDMNGYEATRQIRQFNKDIIIIAQTAFAQTYDRIKALEAGCNDHIAKPIIKETFLPLIQKYFNSNP